MNKDLTPVGKGGSSSEDLRDHPIQEKEKDPVCLNSSNCFCINCMAFFRIHQIESLAETEMAEQQLVFSKRLDSLNLDFSQRDICFTFLGSSRVK